MPTAYPTEETAFPTEERILSVYGDIEQEDFSIDLGTLNITSEEIDFDEIDDDLERFQEDETVQQALQRGVDLRKYAEELSAQLKEAEAETVCQYMENKGDVTTLHEQMEDCDAVLARMQEMLLGFQADLGGISEEIKHLQDESLSMNIRLKNRRAAEELMHKFLDQTAVNPEMAAIINTSPINEDFQAAVVDLNKKLLYLQQKVPSRDGTSLDLIPCETHVGQTLLPELEKLKARCITKIKDYFVHKFKELRRPKTNIQMLQQNALVKFSPLLKFLQEENPSAAEEIRSWYVEAMGKTIFNLFKNYYHQLVRLDEVKADRHDLVAMEEAAVRSMFTQKVNLSKRSDAFTLGERDRILDQVESEPILVHVATAESQSFPYEVILRSVVKHLSDAATSEFLFILDFFKTNSQ
ncbi:VPS52, partial [Symbiodinium microadriaticum]